MIALLIRNQIFFTKYVPFHDPQNSFHQENFIASYNLGRTGSAEGSHSHRQEEMAGEDDQEHPHQ